MMFMFTSTHLAAMAAKDAEIKELRADKAEAEAAYNIEYSRVNRLSGRITTLTSDVREHSEVASYNAAERDKALAELADLRAKRARANANLRNYKPAPVAEGVQ